MADLNILKNKKSQNSDETEVWSKCQFLVRRIDIGDRVVMQFEALFGSS